MAKIKYFFRYYKKSYFSLFLPSKGSLQSSDERPDSTFILNHTKTKMLSYEREHLYSEIISANRVEALVEIINRLKNRGSVYLVKLPVLEEMIRMENIYAPEFNDLILPYIDQEQVHLIDFYPISNQFLLEDGNHLWKGDADKVSSIIGEIIAMNEKRGVESSPVNLLHSYISIMDDNLYH